MFRNTRIAVVEEFTHTDGRTYRRYRLTGTGRMTDLLVAWPDGTPLYAGAGDLARQEAGRRLTGQYKTWAHPHLVRPVPQCAYCGHTGAAAEFEPFNPAGNLACRDVKACALRQVPADVRPGLDAMAREVRAACPAHAGPGCDCRWQLADRIEASLGVDSDTAALLAVALSGHLAGIPG